MTFIEKRPPWLDRLARLIDRSWAHHGCCRNLHVSCVFDADTLRSEIRAK
jgi:hypothetical protein